MATMQFLTALNNQGIALLESEDAEDAMNIFRRGFVILRGPIRWMAADATTSSGNQTCQIQSSNALTSLTQENIYVFCRAIRICSQGDIDQGNTHDALRESFLFASVFLFNSALANHLQGKLSGQIKYFKKASKLYDAIVKLVLYHCHHDKRLQHIVMIALNNRAQIHYEYMSDHLESQQLFQTLSELMASQGNVDGIDQEGYHFLLQNALCMRFHGAAGAA